MTILARQTEAAPSLKKVRSSGEEAKPQRIRDRAGKQQALLEAALQLFASKGYEVTTTREIAAAAGCAEGLIHRYFDGKAGLLRALVEQKVSRTLWQLGSLAVPAATFEEEFIRLIEGEVERMWQNRDFLRVFIPQAMVDPSLGNMMRQALISGRSKIIGERLKGYPACAALSPEDLDVLIQSVAILGLIFGFMRPIILGQERTSAQSMAIRFAEIMLRAVSSPDVD
jgi:TetR/AcrR family transcriptional regulator, regulator of cefoperazone and chloramphenicol sensitivity